MAILISYSHADAAFVEKLSMELVKHNVHVWIDKWELNVGDSILNWVQKSIQESGALLVVLSKTSVASAWCNKELTVRKQSKKQSKKKHRKVSDKPRKLNQRQAGYLKGLAEGKSKLAAALEAGYALNVTRNAHRDIAQGWRPQTIKAETQENPGQNGQAGISPGAHGESGPEAMA